MNDVISEEFCEVFITHFSRSENTNFRKSSGTRPDFPTFSAGHF